VRIAEIRALGPEELKRQLEESRRELFNLHLRHATRQLVNSAEMGKVKKKIARFQTILREREIGLEKD
jgi:large subunit ribosomal protein L29